MDLTEIYKGIEENGFKIQKRGLYLPEGKFGVKITNIEMGQTKGDIANGKQPSDKVIINLEATEPKEYAGMVTNMGFSVESGAETYGPNKQMTFAFWSLYEMITVMVNEEYLSRNYPNGNYTHLVGENGRVIQVAEVGQGAWDVGGDWNAETYAAIEFGEKVTSQEDFNKSYKAYIELARDLAKQAGIPLTLDTPEISGIKTHNYASRTGHGSDHVDPIAFLTKWGVSYAQLKHDIENGFSNGNGEKPKTKKKKGELMLLFKESDGKIYFLLGNTYTYVGTPKELNKLKVMMNKAGYDTWEHTDPEQIKYLKRLAKNV